MPKTVRFTLHRLCLVILILLSTIGCDQVTKTVMRRSLPVTGPLEYLGNHLRLEYAENPGAFLNLGAAFSTEIRFWIFYIGVSLSLLLLAIFLLKSSSKLRPNTLIGLSLVLGGGIGNLLDRFIFGHVNGFIFVQWGPLHSGIFNFADIVILAGGTLIVLPQLFNAPRLKAISHD